MRKLIGPFEKENIENTEIILSLPLDFFGWKLYTSCWQFLQQQLRCFSSRTHQIWELGQLLACWEPLGELVSELECLKKIKICQRFQFVKYILSCRNEYSVFEEEFQDKILHRLHNPTRSQKFQCCSCKVSGFLTLLVC